MAKRCYYEVLEVERTVNDDELKRAFRKLALKWHPDRNPGNASSEARFKEINEAYDILKDPEKRAAYDRFGHAAFEGRDMSAAAGFGTEFGFSDLFAGVFNMGAGPGARSNRGADLRYDLQITLDEAFAGKTAQLRLTKLMFCETCSGTGAKAGTRPTGCLRCGGTGRKRQARGFFTLELACSACNGRGEIINSPCPSCSGAGRVTRERKLSVNIPAGVEHGTRVRIPGEGEAGVHGGPAGDLYILVSLASHEFFQRDGADLHCLVPIPMVLATLGGEFEVPTIGGGKTFVKVPEGTQSGSRFRLRGKGMPLLNSRQIGDMFVQVVVETPQKLSERQRELLREFQKASSKDTSHECTD
jgi:molecular chaperone DnaJ